MKIDKKGKRNMKTNTEIEQKNVTNGLKISFVNTCMIIVAAILAISLFMISGNVRKSYDQAIQRTNEYIRFEKQADTVHEASDYLTNEVRLFVETTDLTHAELYFEEANVTRRREAALDVLTQQDAGMIDALNEAVGASRELMKREIYAMRLVCSVCGYEEMNIPPEVQAVSLEAEDAALSPDEKLEKARLIVFDDTYQEAKTEIYNALELFVAEILDKTKQEFDHGNLELSKVLSLQTILTCVLIVMVGLISLVIVFLIIRPLRVYLDCIQKQQLLTPTGAYEFRYLAQVYNEIYTQNKKSVAEKQVLRHKAEHDQMTGLLNRVSAETRVHEFLADSQNRGILILLDIDGLKWINDNLGHKAGDKAIMSLAMALKNQFRDSDVIGRIGGDEFLLYLPGAADKRDAISLALTSMQKKLSEVRVGKAGERSVHCSIGCAVQTSEADTYEELFKQADIALYHVKRSVKNSFAFFEPKMLEDNEAFMRKN